MLKRFKWIMFNERGGGDDEPTPPPQPTAQETSAQAIQAQIDALPQILAAQQQYSPQFTQLSLDQLQQFGPQGSQALLDLENQYGTQYAQALKAEQEAANPELAQARKVLTDYLGQEEMLTPQEQRQFEQDLRGSQGVRGFALESGVGAQDELSKLTALRQQLKERRLNIALSTAGRAPVTGSTQYSTPQTSSGQLVQNVDPGSIFGLASNNYSTGANLYSTQLANQASKRQFTSDLIGGGIGFMGGIGAGQASAGSKVFGLF